MNPLSKLQALMVCFVFLLFPAYFVDQLLLILAAFLVVIQLLIARSELRRDYPEEWIKYTAVFLVYEVAMTLLIFVAFRMAMSSLGISSIYWMFAAMLFVLLLVISLRYLIGRRYCYGTVLFSSGEWIGVSIKGDLFSRIAEADYAVRNPLHLKLKKGDRVKIRLKTGIGLSAPFEVIEVSKAKGGV